jgi:flavin-dependent dehydrogenase
VTGTSRILLAGDAGGFVNGVTAEGIYYAMVSGELAGRAAAAATRGGAGHDAGLQYERAWNREIGSELRDAVALQRLLFSNRSALAQMVRDASPTSPLTTTLLAFFRGEIPYAAVRRRILLRHPLTAIRLARHRRQPWEVAS